jgi:hypothetical protein
MVETFVNVDGAPSLLRIETTKEGKEIKIPPFVRVLKDVTEDNSYASSSMAKHAYKMPEADKKAIGTSGVAQGQQKTSPPKQPDSPKPQSLHQPDSPKPQLQTSKEAAV